MRRPVSATATLLAAVAVTAAGCGGGGQPATTGDTSTTSTATTDRMSAEAAGKTVFLGVSGCGACHTLADAGSTGTIASNLDEKAPSVERVRDVVANGSGAMPPFRKQLTEQQIADVAAYVAAVAGRAPGSG